MKRIALAAAALSVAALGAVVSPAAAADCPEGTVVEAHVNLDINGEAQSHDVCLPPAE